MDFKDYYSTLGVAKTATDKEIKQAFRKLARKYHPDVNPGDKAAESRFKEINEAYEVLSHADNRRRYDELGANWRMYEQAGAARGAGPQAGWSAGFGGRPGGFRTMTEDEVEDLFGNADPFSDFFKTFFGRGREVHEPGRRARGARTRTHQGRDIEHEIELSLEDAFRGVSRHLSIKDDGHTRGVEVRIPPGVSDGSRVRVTGEGEHGMGGAPSGDLYLRIRLTPHPVFERKGRDLYTRVAVPLTTAVLGGETTVHTVDQRTLRLKIPATTQNAQVFRLKGHGMPGVGTQAPGDLYATVEVQLPTRLTSDERSHFEALRKLESKRS
jgi:DnaJ-class molecular chaperone